jgi:hypothetical protein
VGARLFEAAKRTRLDRAEPRLQAAWHHDIARSACLAEPSRVPRRDSPRDRHRGARPASPVGPRQHEGTEVKQRAHRKLKISQFPIDGQGAEARQVQDFDASCSVCPSDIPLKFADLGKMGALLARKNGIKKTRVRHSGGILGECRERRVRRRRQSGQEPRGVVGSCRLRASRARD